MSTIRASRPRSFSGTKNRKNYHKIAYSAHGAEDARDERESDGDDEVVRFVRDPDRGRELRRVALLICYQGANFVGRIDFIADGSPLDSDYLWHPSSPSITYIVLNMPASRFAVVADTVRQEKPLQLYIDVDASSGSTTDGHGYLVTGDREPIGELAG